MQRDHVAVSVSVSVTVANAFMVRELIAGEQVSDYVKGDRCAAPAPMDGSIKLLYMLLLDTVVSNSSNLDQQYTFRNFFIYSVQGCQPSPLLFTLAGEPLAIAGKSQSSISGIRIRDTEHHIAFFVDDVTFS